MIQWWCMWGQRLKHCRIEDVCVPGCLTATMHRCLEIVIGDMKQEEFKDRIGGCYLGLWAQPCLHIFAERRRKYCSQLFEDLHGNSSVFGQALIKLNFFSAFAKLPFFDSSVQLFTNHVHGDIPTLNLHTRTRLSTLLAFVFWPHLVMALCNIIRLRTSMQDR